MEYSMLKSKSKEAKQEFYHIDTILSKNCQYSMVISERSNGKTFSALEVVIKNYYEKGEQGAYIRRWQEDYKKQRAQQLCEGLETTGRIAEITNGEWTHVKFTSGRWYLCRKDDDLNNMVMDDEPFMFAFALSDMEHDKSTSYTRVTTVIFDEFLTRSYYLPDEFVIFMNVLSTIIRRRTNVRIIMLANTVNKYAPYFKEMGLRHVAEMEPGKIDIYTYGDSPLRVAVERPVSLNKKNSESTAYFAFDNPSLSMITGGAWEIDIYPHCPRKFLPKEIIFVFFIDFNDCLLQCEVVYQEDCRFLYIHQKTTPIQDEDKDFIFAERHDPRPNHFRNLRRGTSKLEQRIGWFFQNDKVFYQDNEVGEVVRNYLNYCKTEGR